MLEAGNVSFDELQVKKYVADLETYWNDNKPVFELNSVRFLYLWGSLITSLGYCASVAEMTKEEFVQYLGRNGVSIFSFASNNEFLEELKNA